MAYEYKRLTDISYNFYRGSAVIYDSKIHILGSAGSRNHYSSNGVSWTKEVYIPYDYFLGSAVVYNNKIHILGDSDNRKNHYSWNGTQWTEESTLPYDFYNGSAVVYDNKIHILGSADSSCYTNHYSWNGTEWVEESTLPYNFYQGSAVVYDGKIHILGCGLNYPYNRKHYSWDGTQWTDESMLPYYFSNGSSVVYGDKIHILGSTSDHYSWNGIEWTRESTLPYSFVGGCAVVYNGKIYTLGGGATTTQKKYFYSGYKNGYNNILYGDVCLLDLSSDTVNSDYLVNGYTAHSKYGVSITGNRPPEFLYPKNAMLLKYRRTYNYSDIGHVIAKIGSGDYSSIYFIHLDKTSDDKSITLWTTKSDDETVSTITIASPGASYIDTFTIDNIHFLTFSLIIIEYSYMTSATARSAKTLRAISIKKDGTLVNGAYYGINNASSATTEQHGIFFPALLGGYHTFFAMRSITTISTGANTLAGWYVYLNPSTCAFQSSSSNTINLSADVDIYCPLFHSDFNPPPTKGGFFYRNASGVDYICIIPHWNSTTRNMTLASADSSGELANIGIENHYILGMLNEGLLVTAKRTGYSWIIYTWVIDLTSTSDILRLYSNFNISLNSDIIAFNNNIFVFNNGDKYQYYNGELSEIRHNEIRDGTIFYGNIGVCGDGFNLVGIG